jgi:hypothetical protein
MERKTVFSANPSEELGNQAIWVRNFLIERELTPYVRSIFCHRMLPLAEFGDERG